MKKILLPLLLFVFIAGTQAVGADRTEAIIKSILEGTSDGKGVPGAENMEIPPKKPAAAEKKDRPAEAQQVPSPDEALLKTGIQLSNADMQDAALAKFNELKSRYPQSPFRDSAVIWSGKIHFNAGRLQEALREFSSVKEDSGEYPAALYHIAATHHKNGGLPGAIEYYYRVSSMFPDYDLADDALLSLGYIYLAQKKGNQALEAAVKIIRYYPDRETMDDAYYLIGKVYEKDPTLKDFEIARKAYRAFLRKAGEENVPVFTNSPLRKRVEKDLRSIEATYFKMEN